MALSFLYEVESVGENNTLIESERHIATIMFTDIYGFTSMSEKIKACKEKNLDIKLPCCLLGLN